MKTQTITWYAPEEMPEEWKDNRELLCVIRDIFGVWHDIVRCYVEDGWVERFISADQNYNPEDIEYLIDLDELGK